MTSLAAWTWISVAVLVVVPPVVFVLFLRDARQVFEDLAGNRPSQTAGGPSSGGTSGGLA